MTTTKPNSVGTIVHKNSLHDFGSQKKKKKRKGNTVGYITHQQKRRKFTTFSKKAQFFLGTKLRASSHVGLRQGTLSNLMDNVLIPISPANAEMGLMRLFLAKVFNKS